MHSACVMNIKNKKFDFAIADIFLRETRKQVQFFLSIFIVLELHYENRFSFMFWHAKGRHKTKLSFHCVDIFS